MNYIKCIPPTLSVLLEVHINFPQDVLSCTSACACKQPGRAQIPYSLSRQPPDVECPIVCFDPQGTA